jgi:hypothetical protein
MQNLIFISGILYGNWRTLKRQTFVKTNVQEAIYICSLLVWK